MPKVSPVDVTFNHGVEGSSPSALTNTINRLARFFTTRTKPGPKESTAQAQTGMAVAGEVEPPPDDDMVKLLGDAIAALERSNALIAQMLDPAWQEAARRSRDEEAGT